MSLKRVQRKRERVILTTTRKFQGKKYTYGGTNFSKKYSDKHKAIWGDRFHIRVVKRKTKRLGTHWVMWIRPKKGVRTTLAKR